MDFKESSTLSGIKLIAWQITGFSRLGLRTRRELPTAVFAKHISLLLLPAACRKRQAWPQKGHTAHNVTSRYLTRSTTASFILIFVAAVCRPETLTSNTSPPLKVHGGFGRLVLETHGRDHSSDQPAEAPVPEVAVSWG